MSRILKVFVFVGMYLLDCFQSLPSKDLENVDMQQNKDTECDSDIDCPRDEKCLMFTCQPKIKEPKKRQIQNADCEDNIRLLCADDFISCAKHCDNVTGCPDEEEEINCKDKCADCQDGKFLCLDGIRCAAQSTNITEYMGGKDEVNCTEPCTHFAECKDKNALVYNMESRIPADDPEEKSRTAMIAFYL